MGLSCGCQVVVHLPADRDGTTQEFSRFGLIKFLSLVDRLGTVAASQIWVTNLNLITTQIGKTLVSSRPGRTVQVRPHDNHLTKCLSPGMNIHYMRSMCVETSFCCRARTCLSNCSHSGAYKERANKKTTISEMGVNGMRYLSARDHRLHHAKSRTA